MTTESSTIDAPAEDAIYFLSVERIHPDPEQPRIHVDADLAASIAEQGVHQPITVRPHPAIEDAWILVDGARRLVGSIAAKAKEIPARIRLDLEDKVERLIVQVTTASGKPLSPLEQAKAFKQMLDADETLTHAKIADRMGIPKSTVGDRIRLLEIHPAWIDLIMSGKLQLSHAPAIHRMRAVPEKYQVQAVERLLSKGTGYGLGHDIAKGEPIRIDTYENKLNDCFRVFIRPVADVPGYDGPVIQINDNWHGPRKYAADPEKWKPIRNAQIKRARDKRAKQEEKAGTDRRPAAPRRNPSEVTLERLEKVDGVTVRGTKAYVPKPGADEVEIYSRGGWSSGFDPETLLASLKPEDVTVVKTTDKQSHNKPVVVVPMTAMVEAVAAYQRQVAEAVRALTKKAMSKITPMAIAQCAVTGPGTLRLTDSLAMPDGWEHFDEGDAELVMSMIAYALGIELEEYEVKEQYITRVAARTKSQPDAEQIVSVFAASIALNVKWPGGWDATQTINQALRSVVPFELKQPKSKKQEKRDARSRGETVGDPSRAPAPAPEVAAAP